METYMVSLSAKATVAGRVRVQATSQAEAEQKALQEVYGGDVIWKYEGADDDTAEVDAVYVEVGGVLVSGE